MQATNPKLLSCTVYVSMQQLGQAFASLLMWEGGPSMAQLSWADIEGAS